MARSPLAPNSALAEVDFGVGPGSEGPKSNNDRRRRRGLIKQTSLSNKQLRRVS